MTDDPFDPPEPWPSQRRPPSRATSRWGLVVGTWGLCGAVVGTAVGVTLQVTQGMAGASAQAGIGGMVAGAGLGLVVLLADRAWARQRPALVTGRGDASRPMHGAVLGTPILLALPALLVLVVVGSVGLQSVIPGLVFAMVALALGWAGQRVWSGHRLARALELVEAGRPGAAGAALSALARHPVASRQARRTARLNLGMLALQEGRGADALDALQGLSEGEAGAWAAVGRALAHLLLDRPPERAEADLKLVSARGASASVLAQADAVRILVVWRRSGPEDAFDLGQRLDGPMATPLHHALLGALRDRLGVDPVPSPEAVVALRCSGLGRSIPELRTADGT